VEEICSRGVGGGRGGVGFGGGGGGLVGFYGIGGSLVFPGGGLSWGGVHALSHCGNLRWGPRSRGKRR